MGQLLLMFATGLVAWCLVPLVRRFAIYVGAVDKPGDRKVHLNDIPRGGGVAVILAFASALIVAWYMGWLSEPLSTALLPILAGASIVFVAGLFDDWKGLSFGWKLSFQVVAAIVAIVSGIQVDSITLFGISLNLGWLSFWVTLLWIVGIINAFNLIDGLDGLASGLAIIAAGTLAFVYAWQQDTELALILVSLVMAQLGFLPYNFNPAKIFLGDSGSQTVGYLLATLSLIGSSRSTSTLSVLIPLLVMGIPIIDTALALHRRLLEGWQRTRYLGDPFRRLFAVFRSIFKADREHIHHRLLILGFSHRKSVLVLYMAALVMSTAVLLSVFAQDRNVGLILFIIGLATYMGVHKLGYRGIMPFRVENLLHWYERVGVEKRFFWAFVDVVLITVAYWLSWVLKYTPDQMVDVQDWYVDLFPVAIFFQMCVFMGLGLNRAIWRAMGIGDVIWLMFAVVFAVGLSGAIMLLREPVEGFYAFLIINTLLLAVLTFGIRSAYRLLEYFSWTDRHRGERVLIYGAGRTGQLVLRELWQNQDLDLQPVGFIDDNPFYHGRLIGRIPVLGGSTDVSKLIERLSISKIVVSTNKIDSNRLQQLIEQCESKNVGVYTMRTTLAEVQGTGPRLVDIEQSFRESK